MVQEETGGTRPRRSVPEAALACAQAAATALVLERAAGAISAAEIQRERIGGGIHVARRRERLRRCSGTRTSGGTRGRPIVGIVHAQPAASVLETVEATDGIRGLGVTAVLSEGEATRAAGLTVGADVDADEIADVGKQGREVLLSGVKAQIPDEDLVRNNDSFQFG